MDGAKGAWVDELPGVLWAYQTTCQTATKETLFSMTYQTEAVIPAEIGEPSFRMEKIDSDLNDQGLFLNLDLHEILEGNNNKEVIT